MLQPEFNKRVKPIEHRMAARSTNKWPAQIKYVQDQPRDALESAKCGNSRIGLRRLMEGRDPDGQFLHVFSGYFSPLQSLLEGGSLRQALHLHGPFDESAVLLNSYSPWRFHNRHDSEIDVRRQAAVEANLLLTEVASPFERAEVQELELHRFLDLVRERAGQEDSRDVGLVHLHARHLERIGRRVA